MPVVEGSFCQLLLEAVQQQGSPKLGPTLEKSRAAYRELTEDEKLAAFDELALAMEIGERERGAWREPVLAGEDEPNWRSPEAVAALLHLRERVDSPRQQVFRQFVNLPGGIKFLVDLRADLRRAMRKHRDRAHYRLVDADLLHLFRAWFTAGFLNLVPINWDETPAAQLEKLMDYEVVHPMTDWDDLRRRLARDRLCYAFYHPNMPGEPLIFVEIALTHTIASSIDDLFDPSKIVRDISEATTAIFYSINATQPGLGGVSLGDSLIKTVVTELQRTLPQLKRFSTLSPIPGFRDRYLEPILRGDEKAAKFELEREEIPGFFDEAGLAALRQARPGEGAVDALAAVLADDAWAEDESLRLAIKAGLLRLCHFYLTREKRGSRPANPVANFHLSNGALIYNLNYLSNTRPKGMAESYGMTVNYRYDLPRIEANQEALRQGECVVSPQLEKMLRLGISA